MDGSAVKPGMEGTQGIEAQRNGARVANPRSVRSSDFLLRSLALVTSLVAIIVLAVSKETKVVSVSLIPTLPPLNIRATAKWQYLSAFVYFMAINIVALVYATISLILSLANRKGSKGMGLLLIILDLMIMTLLFSANSAAMGVGLIAYNGNSHTRWNKICNMFESNCRHVAASIGVSLTCSIIFFLLVILNIMNLLRRSHH